MSKKGRKSSVEIIEDIVDLIYTKNPEGLQIQEIANALALDRKTVIKYSDLLIRIKLFDTIGSKKKIYLPKKWKLNELNMDHKKLNKKIREVARDIFEEEMKEYESKKK